MKKDFEKFQSFKKFPAIYKSLDEISLVVRSACLASEFDEEAIYLILLSVSEACSNIIEHAYRFLPEGYIELGIALDQNSITILLRDGGKAFDPLTIPPPNIHTNIDERAIGGLGLYFIRNFMDEVLFFSVSESESMETGIPAGNFILMTKRKGNGK